MDGGNDGGRESGLGRRFGRGQGNQWGLDGERPIWMELGEKINWKYIRMGGKMTIKSDPFPLNQFPEISGLIFKKNLQNANNFVLKNQ